MIKEVVTYQNFEGETVTEVLWFHISKGELLEWYSEEGPDLPHKLVAIADSEDKTQLISTFRMIIAKGYGERIEGSSTRFLKSKDRTDAFMASPALDELVFGNLLGDEKRAAAFFNGMFPADMVAEVQAQMEAGGTEKVRATAVGGHKASASTIETDLETVVRRTGLATPYGKDAKLVHWAYRHPTPKEQQEMTKPQLVECMQRQMSDWQPPDAI